ncbi:MAG: AAA family ATPase [Ignavibacteriaceae bacterium]|nr:AAA family ATPase [Ignavibacteriaceae bacterium]
MRFLSNFNSVILTGAAGTGKTYQIGQLVKELYQKNTPFVLLAPTGRAAAVIREKTGFPASTIHKCIYEQDKLLLNSDDDEHNSEFIYPKFSFSLKSSDHVSGSIIIVDEASMVSDIYSESETLIFGSGFLLTDLLTFAGKYEERKNKIIFVGDKFQLPPINMNYSPALNPNHLKQHGFETEVYELVENYRQKAGSGIINLVNPVRESLEKGIYNKLILSINNQDTFRIDANEIMQFIKQRFGKISPDDNLIMVTATNAQALEFNLAIRKEIFNFPSNLTPSDWLMCVANSYYFGTDFVNGDIFKILGAKPELVTIKRKIPKKQPDGSKGETIVDLKFREVVIGYTDEEGKITEKTVLIIENLLYSPHRDLIPDEHRALFIDTISRFGKKRPAKRDYLHDPKAYENAISEYKKELTRFFRNDKYYNALRVKYAYAVTCHKAQGGEWDNVIVDCRSSGGYLNQNYFKWLYTACTRAKKNLFLINPPHFDLLAGLRPESKPMFMINSTKSVLVIKQEFLDDFYSAQYTSDSDIRRLIAFIVTERIKDEGLNITQILSHQFQEEYRFSYGQKTMTSKIYYNNKNEITSIICTGDSDINNRLNPALQELCKKRIIVVTEETRSFTFPNQFLEEIYKNIFEKIANSEIKIHEITHHSFMEKYHLTDGNEMIEVDIFYNGKNQITKKLVKSTGTENPDFLAKLQRLIL